MAHFKASEDFPEGEINGTIHFNVMPEFIDDVAAKSGGLVSGDLYKLPSGSLKVVL